MQAQGMAFGNSRVLEILVGITHADALHELARPVIADGRDPGGRIHARWSEHAAAGGAECEPPEPDRQKIERLGLKVDRILPLHGRVVPVAELYAAAGKPLPAR